MTLYGTEEAESKENEKHDDEEGNTTEAESKENKKDEDKEGTTTTAEDTAAHENGGNGNMNVLEHESIDLSEGNIEDDIDHTLYSSIVCV